MDLPTSVAFEEASAEVLAYLHDAIPMGLWAVSRYDGERQVVLTADGSQYPLSAGDSVPWSDTMCRHSIAGTAPEIAPDAMSVPVYASTPVASALTVGSYVGLPIRQADGGLFGSLCAIDPDRRDAEFEGHHALLSLLTQLLGRVLDADLERTAAATRLVAAEAAADTDPLTGLLNRRGWTRMAEVAVERGRRFGDPATVLAIDVDNLKVVNDTEGHAAGDQLIGQVAAVLRRVARATDSVARVGGDEFVIIAECAPGDGERLRDRLERTLDDAGTPCSVGSAALDPRSGLNVCLAEADASMYARKHARRTGRILTAH